MGSPSASAAAMAPQKASPAPVVSTALTRWALRWRSWPSTCAASPSSPSVITQPRVTSTARRRAASGASALVTGVPSRSDTSISFTTSRSIESSGSAVSGSTGEAFITRMAPSGACSKAARTAVSGTSRWTTTTAGLSAATAFATSSGLTLRLAPSATAIELAPELSTAIIAVPVAASGVRAT